MTLLLVLALGAIFADAQTWHRSSNGSEIRITDGNFSHSDDANGTGYEDDSSGETQAPQQVQVRGPNIYHINARGEILGPYAAPSHHLRGGIENANFYSENLAWPPAREILQKYVRELLPSSGINLKSLVAKKAVENVVRISIPALEVLAEMKAAGKLQNISAKDLNKIKELILKDPISILVLAAATRIPLGSTESEFEIVQKHLVALENARDSKWLGFVRGRLAPEILKVVEQDKSQRFNDFRSPSYMVYISAHAENFVEMDPDSWGSKACDDALKGKNKKK